MAKLNNCEFIIETKISKNKKRVAKTSLKIKRDEQNKLRPIPIANIICANMTKRQNIENVCWYIAHQKHTQPATVK